MRCTKMPSPEWIESRLTAIVKAYPSMPPQKQKRVVADLKVWARIIPKSSAAHAIVVTLLDSLTKETLK